MKKLFSTILMMFIIGIVSAQEVNFYTTPTEFKVEPGGEFTLPICLKNNIDITGCQLHMYLPEGISVAKNSRNRYIYSFSRLDEHSTRFDPEALDGNGGQYVLILMSGYYPLLDNDGELVSITFNVDENITLGEKAIKITDIIFNHVDEDDNIIELFQNDMTIPVDVYQNFSVSAKSANEAMGSVTIDGGGETVESGSKVTVTATPATGYEFLNWTVGESVVSTENPYSFTVAKDAALVANFRIKKFNVSFDVDGQVTTESLEYGTVITAPTNIKKEGHTFAGWEPEFVEGTTVPANDLTYKAKWTVNQYTITFDTDGGTEIAPITQDFGTDITAPDDPAKTGYTFMGWSEDIPATMPAKDLNLTATWQINSYNVVFVVDGEEISRVTQEYGTLITAPADPVKKGYIFDGWDPAYVEGATVPAFNITYTAKWIAGEFTITFDSNGGSYVAPIVQIAGTPVVAPADPKRDYYIFKGWNQEIPEVMPTENLTLVAQWEIDNTLVKADMELFLSGVDIVDIPEADEFIMQEVPYDYGQIVKAYDEACAALRTISGEPLYAAFLKAQEDLAAYMNYCNENGSLTVYEYTLGESWGTLILPFQYKAPEGWTFYSVSTMLEEGSNLLRLDVVESISANTPYLVNGSEGKKILFAGHVKSDVKNVADGMLTGVLSGDYTPQPGDYVLQTKEEGTGFYRVEEASQVQVVGVARCYLTLPADMEQFDVVYVERLTTSIDSVASQDEDAPIFNLAGQRKAKLSRGINIVGGKIVICK